MQPQDEMSDDQATRKYRQKNTSDVNYRTLSRRRDWPVFFLVTTEDMVVRYVRILSYTELYAECGLKYEAYLRWFVRNYDYAYCLFGSFAYWWSSGLADREIIVLKYLRSKKQRSCMVPRRALCSYRSKWFRSAVQVQHLRTLEFFPGVAQCAAGLSGADAPLFLVKLAKPERKHAGHLLDKTKATMKRRVFEILHVTFSC